MSIVQDPSVYRFGDFTLDVPNRELRRDDDRVDLNARYFDALVLLVREHGRLVEKDRFFAEVWDDVVVTDSALTQCIKDIRRQLGDDASNPRFVQTVPRHGYRFIADVTTPTSAVGAVDDDAPAASAVEAPPLAEAPPSVEAPSSVEASSAPAPTRPSALTAALGTALAGTLGGAAAGVLGGLLYGFGLAYAPLDQDLGTASILLVLISLSGFAGTVGGFGVGAGIAAADYAAGGRTAWRILGAVLGGMLVGGIVKLLGVDAFNLLFGRAPAGVTGGVEGAALGLAVGLAARLGGVETGAWHRPVAAAAAAGAVVGVTIALAGGHLMGGSLDLLAQSFSDSRLTLDAIGRYFGEVRFGQTSQVVLAGIEGLIFAACVVGALAAAPLSRPGDERTADR